MTEFEQGRSGTAPEALMAIGEVSSRYNVTLRALRFYEDRGLLSPRRSGTARFYDDGSIRRLELILKGKKLGFTLSEIRQMVRSNERDASAEPALTLAPDQLLAQIELLQRQRVEIEHAISELQSTRYHLEQSGGGYATLLAAPPLAPESQAA